MSTLRVYITFDQPNYYSIVISDTHTCSTCAVVPSEYSVVKVDGYVLTCTGCLIAQNHLAECVTCGKLRRPENLTDFKCVMCRLRVPCIDQSALIVMT
jgi:hypothetical protein